MRGKTKDTGYLYFKYNGLGIDTYIKINYNPSCIDEFRKYSLTINKYFNINDVIIAAAGERPIVHRYFVYFGSAFDYENVSVHAYNYYT